MTTKEKETLSSLLNQIRELAKQARQARPFVAWLGNIVDPIEQKAEAAIQLLSIIPPQ